jgi:hypothetical protein
MIVLLIGAGVAGILLGVTDSFLFRLPAALMALLIAAVLIVRTDIDVGLTALTASLFCGGYLVGVVIANTRLRMLMWLSSDVATIENKAKSPGA